MSAEQPAQPPAEPKPEEKKPTIEQLIANQQKQIDLLAQGIVALNKKLEEKAGTGGAGGGADAIALIKELTGTGKSANPLEDFAKQAEALARAGDAIDRFRNPPRLGPGEALLMRLGVRAGYPRYMTKAELARVEREMGIYEALGGEGGSEGGEGGEHSHIKE